MNNWRKNRKQLNRDVLENSDTVKKLNTRDSPMNISDVWIYAHTRCSFTPEDLLATLAARGIHGTFIYRYPSEQREPSNWTGGYVYLEGVDRAFVGIDLSRQEFDTRCELISPLHISLDPKIFEELRSMTISYSIECEGEQSEIEILQEMFMNLVEIIATNTGGYIISLQEQKVFSVKEFRKLASIHSPD